MLVSILLPIRFYSPQVSSSVESLLCQTYSNFELVVILNDADAKVVEIIHKYSDLRMRVLEKTNLRNLSEALNYGAKHCKGAWIFRADADDIYSRDRLITQLHFASQFAFDITLLGMTSDKTVEVEKGGLKRIQVEDLLFSNPIVHSSVMIKREFLLQNPYDVNYKFSQDYELWTRAVKKGCVIVTDKKIVKVDGSVRSGKYVLEQEYFFLKANLKFIVDNLLKNRGCRTTFITLRALRHSLARCFNLLRNTMRYKIGRW